MAEEEECLNSFFGITFFFVVVVVFPDLAC